jgi:hypothetical protein
MIVCVQQICYQSGTPKAQFGEAKKINVWRNVIQILKLEIGTLSNSNG